jgi:hypothetical protein
MANGDMSPDVAGNAPESGPQDAGGSPPPSPPGAPPGPPGAGGGALPFLRRGPQPSAPGPGDQAHSMSMIQNAIAMLDAAVMGIPIGHPLRNDVRESIKRLEKHMAQGQPTVGVQKTQITDLLQQIARSGFLSRILQQQGQGGPPGAPPGAPMPSTPLPGA